MSNAKNQLKTLDKQVYSYWTALYQSFYSAYLYVDVGKRWKGLGCIYLFLVIALVSLPYSIKAIENFSQDFEQDLMKPFSQLPPLYIQNGKISIDQPQPYLIKNNKNQVVILIDVSGKITGFTKEYPDLMVLITANKILMLPPTPNVLPEATLDLTKRTPLVQTLDASTNGVFSGKLIQGNPQIAHIKLFSQLMIYPLLLSVFYGMLMTIFPVFALLAQFFSLVFFKFSLPFKKACRLLIVASTPTLLLLFIYITFDVNFQGMGWTGFILLVAYFSFAVYSLKKDSQLLTRV